MAKFSWSEVFMSIEGEGPYSGWPTVYIRFTGCNMECRGFNNPEMLDTTSTNVLGFDPTDYSNINDIPLISKGCDSIYAWDEKFKHMWFTGSENELAIVVKSTIPHHEWRNPTSASELPVILSLTGGEPTLRGKTIPTLLDHPLMLDVHILLIETNCSVPLHPSFLEYLENWVKQPEKRLIWSNSPKLSISGEPRDKAIRPEIARAQLDIASSRDHTVEQYFKFVCASEEDFNEVEEVMNMYHINGISYSTPVYIMPAACLEEQQQNIAASIADLCIKRGYIYCHRIQNSVFGNGVGT
ncbi:MAG: hypothetical protein CTY12_03440 [Methylotenera sp.]|nr:MAG: hypothetical protein CTY12_03440 [Methylotenera sp.]